MSLIAWYKMEDSSDSSGNNHNGSATNVTYNTGKIGQCGVFNGTAYTRITNHTDFNTPSALSVFMWINGNAGGNTYILAHYDYGNGNRAWLVRSDTNYTTSPLVYLSDDGSFNAGHLKGYYWPAIMNGAWHHIGFTWNAGTLLLYADGELITPIKNKDDAITTIYNANCDVTVSCALNNGTPAALTTVNLDDIRIYNDVLTYQQVLSLYNNNRGFDAPYPWKRRKVITS
jgi:hypothetical protein